MRVPFTILLFAVILGTSAFRSPAQAAEPGLSAAELEALVTALDERTTGREPACPTPSEKIRVVLFEGAGGYCPRYAYLNMQYGADGKTLAERLVATKENYENLDSLRKIRALVGAEDRARNCYLARNIQAYQSALPAAERARFEIAYYSKDGDDDAAKCAHAAPKNAGPLRVVGFSMGGYAAIQYAAALNAANVPIEEALTLDPVGKNVLWVTGVFFTLDNPFHKRTPNVAHWQNIFQKIDTKSLYDSSFFHLGARGSRVIDADTNYEMTAEDFRTPWELAHPHYAINLTESAQSALRDIFR